MQTFIFKASQTNSWSEFSSGWNPLTKKTFSFTEELPILTHKNRNHSIDKFQNLGYDRWLIHKQFPKDLAPIWLPKSNRNIRHRVLLLSSEKLKYYFFKPRKFKRFLLQNLKMKNPVGPKRCSINIVSIEVLKADGTKKNSKRKPILLILDDQVTKNTEIVTNSHKFSCTMQGLHSFSLICFQFWLLHWNVCIICDWPKLW